MNGIHVIYYILALASIYLWWYASRNKQRNGDMAYDTTDEIIDIIERDYDFLNLNDEETVELAIRVCGQLRDFGTHVTQVVWDMARDNEYEHMARLKQYDTVEYIDIINNTIQQEYAKMVTS